MAFGAKISLIDGSLRVVKTVDSDLVCLEDPKYWNPWHIMGLASYLLKSRFGNRQNDWWLCYYNKEGTNGLDSWENRTDDALPERTTTDTGQD